MRKFIKKLIATWCLIPLLTLTACVDEEEYPNTAQGMSMASTGMMYIIYIRYARGMKPINISSSRCSRICWANCATAM